MYRDTHQELVWMVISAGTNLIVGDNHDEGTSRIRIRQYSNQDVYFSFGETGSFNDFCVFKEQLLAFSNPHSVTISGTAHSLKRISEGNGTAVFRKNAANLEITLTLRHSRENKKADGSQIDRHNVELVMTTWDVNGKPEVTQVYAVARSRVGADPAVVTGVLDALGVQLDAQSASIVESDVGP